MTTMLDLLNQRRSTPSRLLSEPAPSQAQLEAILTAAMRVPDHGALAPWRVLVIKGDSRLRLGEFLAQRSVALNPEASAAALEKERMRFACAPLILTVIANLKHDNKVPEIEQILSAGNLCFTLLQAAQALDFGAQWLTAWAAYDATVMAHLGLHENECIVGFIHIGSSQHVASERRRPDWKAHVSVWEG